MNNEKNIFEIATRNKYRFDFRGQQSVEDLWVLPTKDLDSIFKGLNSKLKQIQEESLLDVKSQQDEELEIKIEIVKYIVKVKLNEEKVRSEAKKKREEKQKLLELINLKENESLQGKSIEELKKMVEELND